MSSQSADIRREIFAKARHVVVKLGTQVLTKRDPDKRGLDTAYIRRVARQVTDLHDKGLRVTVVSSGAIGAGCMELGLDVRPTDVADQQAVAAVGQRRLMTHMHDAFARYGLGVGQVLLTRSDFDDRVRYLNIRNCITRLHELGCVPILNENDAVAVEELRFGDNDLLAALTCNALRADLLVLLTVVDGLHDESGETIGLVQSVRDVRRFVRGDTTTLGSGGMASKLEAARLVTDAGEAAVIADGRAPNVLVKLIDGKPLGTLFVPVRGKLSSRLRWIGLTKRPAGWVVVDDGAARALCKRGKSLLASGITGVSGRFDRGAVIEVRDSQGSQIARGLINYDAAEVRKIMGYRSNQFEKLLGRAAFAEVVHRDNLVLIGA